MYEPGFDPADVEAGHYGQKIHFWNLEERRLEQSVDLGPEGLIPLEIRWLHDPDAESGFVGAALCAQYDGQGVVRMAGRRLLCSASSPVRNSEDRARHWTGNRAARRNSRRPQQRGHEGAPGHGAQRRQVVLQRPADADEHLGDDGS